MGLALLDNVFSGSGGIAKTLHNLFGGTGTIANPGTETYNPLNGQSATAPGTSFDTDPSPPENYSIKEIDGSNILKTDLKTTIPASDVTSEIVPEKSTLTIGSSVFTIISANPIKSGNETAIYQLQLRK